MAALDFPASPSNGQTYTGPGGVVWIWDGAKWVTQGIGGGFYLPIAGGTMTGPLQLVPGSVTAAALRFDPTANTGLYGAAGSVSVATSGTARLTVNDTGVLSTVPITLPGAPTLPLNAATKGYVDGGFLPLTSVPSVQNNVGRNLIHNPLFNISQRGAGPWSAGGYTLDRWQLNNNGDTHSLSAVGLSDGDRANIGDEAAQTALYTNFTGSATATAYSFIGQNIEDVRRLAGKTITISFWAVCGTAGRKLGINFMQSFGSGGSPSGAVWALATGQSVNLTTTPARYSVTITLPSIAGKTLGTNANTSFTQFALWYSAASNNAALSGNIGVQSGIIWIWGVQLEIGSTMTPLEKPDPQQDLAKCQRFYIGEAFIIGQYAGSSGTYVNLFFPQSMRATPTITLSGLVYTNGSAASVNSAQKSNALLVMTTTAGSNSILQANYAASADL